MGIQEKGARLFSSAMHGCASETPGGLSGATLCEAVSWGKVYPDKTSGQRRLLHRQHESRCR